MKYSLQVARGTLPSIVQADRRRSERRGLGGGGRGCGRLDGRGSLLGGRGGHRRKTARVERSQERSWEQRQGPGRRSGAEGGVGPAFDAQRAFLADAPAAAFVAAFCVSLLDGLPLDMGVFVLFRGREGKQKGLVQWSNGGLETGAAVKKRRNGKLLCCCRRPNGEFCR